MMNTYVQELSVAVMWACWICH